MKIPYLEIPVTHRCTLRCESCSAYSNFGLTNEIEFETYCKDLINLSKRIAPEYVRILGGEPMLHPYLTEIIKFTRELFPESRMQLCTNGTIYRKEVLEALEFYNCELWVSIHSKDLDYCNKLNYNIGNFTKHKIKIGFGDNISNWNRFYQGNGDDIIPFADGNPEKSYEVCHSKHCVNLLDGKLWKCPQIAGLHILNDKMKLREEWKDYLEYDGLEVTCTDNELESFFNREAERICRMCPTEIINYEKSIR